MILKNRMFIDISNLTDSQWENLVKKCYSQGYHVTSPHKQHKERQFFPYQVVHNGIMSGYCDRDDLLKDFPDGVEIFYEDLFKFSVDEIKPGMIVQNAKGYFGVVTCVNSIAYHDDFFSSPGGFSIGPNSSNDFDTIVAVYNEPARDITLSDIRHGIGVGEPLWKFNENSHKKEKKLLDLMEQKRKIEEEIEQLEWEKDNG